MSSKFIVRQPIKDLQGHIIGYELQYYGANQAFSSESSAASEYAAADTIYNFLTENTNRVLRGSLHFMTFTTTLLMKKTPRLFDKSELVIQIDDSVIIHPLALHFVQQYAKEGYKIAVNEFQFAPRYLALLDDIDYIKLNVKDTNEISMKNIVEIAHSMKSSAWAPISIQKSSTKRRSPWGWMPLKAPMWLKNSPQKPIAALICRATSSG